MQILVECDNDGYYIVVLCEQLLVSQITFLPTKPYTESIFDHLLGSPTVIVDTYVHD